MPELPEVQTVVEGLRTSIVGKKIEGVLFCDSLKSIKSTSVAAFEKQVKGREIVDVQRRAKNILIYLSGGKLLHVHLKMTGHLLIMPREYTISPRGRWEGDTLPEELQDPINQFIHVSLALSGDMQMAFSDMRKFGYIHVVTEGKVSDIDEAHGPEPVHNPDFTFAVFLDRLTGSNVPIKVALLDQKRISGIGNIYGDEILFLAGVRPQRRVRSLTKKDLKAIYERIEPVLLEAINLRGTSIGDFRDTEGKKGVYQDSRLVYGREGEPCPTCGTSITRLKVGQRSAHYCHQCQK